MLTKDSGDWWFLKTPRKELVRKAMNGLDWNNLELTDGFTLVQTKDGRDWSSGCQVFKKGLSLNIICKAMKAKD